MHTIGIHAIGTKVTQKLTNFEKNLDGQQQKQPPIAVLRSFSRPQVERQAEKYANHGL